MSFRLSSLTQSQDERIAQLQLRIQSLQISRDDISLMEMKKADVAGKLVDLESEKIELMRRLQFELEVKDKQLLVFSDQKAKCSQIKRDMILEIKRQEQQIKRFEAAVVENDEKLRDLKGKEFKMRDDRQILLKQQRVFDQQIVKLQEESKTIDYQKAILIGRLSELRIETDEQVKETEVSLGESQTYRLQVNHNSNNLKELFKQLDKLQSEAKRVTTSLQKQDTQNMIFTKELEAKESRMFKLTQQLGVLEKEHVTVSLAYKQLKQTIDHLTLNQKSKSIQLSSIQIENQRLTKQQAQIKSTVEEKEQLLKQLSKRVETIDNMNRLMKTQLQSMRMDDISVRSILDAKWKDFEYLTDNHGVIKNESLLKNHSILRQIGINSLKIESLRSTESSWHKKEV